MRLRMGLAPLVAAGMAPIHKFVAGLSTMTGSAPGLVTEQRCWLEPVTSSVGKEDAQVMTRPSCAAT